MEDEKTYGQIAHEAYLDESSHHWDKLDEDLKDCWEAAAFAVISAFEKDEEASKWSNRFKKLK